MNFQLSDEDEADLAELNKNPIFRAVWALAQKWVTQESDYDEDTEQQITDGWTLLFVLSAPNPEEVSTKDLTPLIDEMRRRWAEMRKSADE